MNAQSLEIEDIEHFEGGVNTEGPHQSGWSYGFAENLSAEEYARRQGIQPLTNIASLYGPGEPEDWQGFDEALAAWRTPLQSREQ